MKKIIIYLFFIALACDIFAIISQNYSLRLITKPILMPLLIFGYIQAVPKSNWLLVVLALFFSFGGDVFLLNKSYFVLGIVSFLLTHLFYVYIIYKFLKQKDLSKIVVNIVPFLALFGCVVVLIHPNLGDLLVPVLVYGFVLSLFGMMSLANYSQNKTKSNLVLLIGTVLFILSDSILSLDKFYISNVVLKVLVMLLYGTAQFIITKIMIEKFKSTVNE